MLPKLIFCCILVSQRTVAVGMTLEKKYFLRIWKIHLTKIIHSPWKTLSPIIFHTNLSDKAVPITRFSLEKCHIAKKSRKSSKCSQSWYFAVFRDILVSQRTVAVGMRLETKYFLRTGKIHLTKVIHFPWKTLSSIIFLANLSVNSRPKIRFSIKTWHIGKISGIPWFGLDLYRKSFDFARPTL